MARAQPGSGVQLHAHRPEPSGVPGEAASRPAAGPESQGNPCGDRVRAGEGAKPVRPVRTGRPRQGRREDAGQPHVSFGSSLRRWTWPGCPIRRWRVAGATDGVGHADRYERESYRPFAMLGHKWHRTGFELAAASSLHARAASSGKPADRLVASAKQDSRAPSCHAWCFTPEWAQPRRRRGITEEQIQALARSDAKAYMPKGPRRLENYVFQVVSRYKDYVKHWNIGNEPLRRALPDGVGSGEPAQCAGRRRGRGEALFRSGQVGIAGRKKSDPEAKIVIEPGWGPGRMRSSSSTTARSTSWSTSLPGTSMRPPTRRRP